MLHLFADYFQFYIQDDTVGVELQGELWTEDAVQRLRIAAAPSVVMIGTARNDEVTVELAFLAHEPAPLFSEWAHAVDADLDCHSGRIVVAGCTDYFPDAKRFEVTPGRYRLRVLYGKPFEGADQSDGLGDHLRYRVELWPTQETLPVRVMKQGPSPWSG